MTLIPEIDEIILGYMPTLSINILCKYLYDATIETIVVEYKINYKAAVYLCNLSMCKIVQKIDGNPIQNIVRSTLINSDDLQLCIWMITHIEYKYKYKYDLYFNILNRKTYRLELCKVYHHIRDMTLSEYWLSQIEKTLSVAELPLYKWLCDHIRYNRVKINIYDSDICNYVIENVLPNQPDNINIHTYAIDVYKKLTASNLLQNINMYMNQDTNRFEILKYKHRNNIQYKINPYNYTIGIDIIKFLFSINHNFSKYILRNIIRYNKNSMEVLKFFMRNSFIPRSVWCNVALHSADSVKMLEYIQSHNHRIDTNILVLAVKNPVAAMQILERFQHVGLNDKRLFRYAVQNKGMGLEVCIWLYEHGAPISGQLYKYAMYNTNHDMALSICKFLYDINTPIVKFSSDLTSLTRKNYRGLGPDGVYEYLDKIGVFSLYD